MRTILAIAPHPDDETLGCGGTLIKHISAGDRVHWLIFTKMGVEQGFTQERIRSRDKEIGRVARAYGFTGVHRLDFPAMMLDVIPKMDLVSALGNVITIISPEVIYLPYRYDVHSDHTAVFDAAASCSKSFRYPTIRSVRAYETLSETEFGIRPDNAGFRPNLFIDITDQLNKKIKIMRLYASEISALPFPRSVGALRAQAQLRGSQGGSLAAEAFMILKEIG
jgi:LmbE family N-acetylglucosaminyl deacetylase